MLHLPLHLRLPLHQFRDLSSAAHDLRLHILQYRAVPDITTQHSTRVPVQLNGPKNMNAPTLALTVAPNGLWRRSAHTHPTHASQPPHLGGVGRRLQPRLCALPLGLRLLQRHLCLCHPALALQDLLPKLRHALGCRAGRSRG